jgi:hypothetical protein
MLNTIELNQKFLKFKEFSESLSKLHPTRKDVYLFPSGNYEFSWKNILEPIFTSPSRTKIAFLLKHNFNLGQIVAMEVETATRDNFHWSLVTEIIGNKNASYVRRDHVLGVDELFPGSLEYLGFNETTIEQSSLKHVTRMHAKTVIWLECLSFLLLEDYDL